jgi:hypothetical protein
MLALMELQESRNAARPGTNGEAVLSMYKTSALDTGAGKLAGADEASGAPCGPPNLDRSVYRCSIGR